MGNQDPKIYDKHSRLIEAESFEEAVARGIWQFDIDPEDESWRDEGWPSLETERVDFRFTVETRFRLVKMCGCLGRGGEDCLARYFDALSTAYQQAKDERAAAPGRPQISRGLQRVIKKTEALITEIDGLHETTRDRLHDAYGETQHWIRAKFSDEAKIDLLAEELRVLRDAAQTSRAGLTAQRGPEKNPELEWIVRELVSIFEDNSGDWATHSASKNSVYDGAPQSEAGAFLRLFFSEADPDLPETRISSALRDEIDHCKEERAAPPAPRVFRGGRYPSIGNE